MRSFHISGPVVHDPSRFMIIALQLFTLSYRPLSGHWRQITSLASASFFSRILALYSAI